jgi:hypothetical protein
VSKLHLTIPYPSFIENIVVYFLLRRRKKRFGYAFRRIKVARDQFAVVDPEDYQKLSEYDWQLWESNGNLYAYRQEHKKYIKMHREILNAPAGSIVDHRYGDGLDNRKVNLRIATIAQNQHNRRKTARQTTSKYKGVSFKRDRKKYYAQIGCNSKRINLGSFDNEVDAAKAYDEAAKKLFGEFARLNFD